MKNPILVLEDKEIIFSVEGDVLSLSTGDGWSLWIYNKHEFVSNSKESVMTGDRKVVAGVYSADECVDISFKDGSSLYVYLTPESYVGPEAMQLTGPNGEIVVWN